MKKIFIASLLTAQLAIIPTASPYTVSWKSDIKQKYSQAVGRLWFFGPVARQDFSQKIEFSFDELASAAQYRYPGSPYPLVYAECELYKILEQLEEAQKLLAKEMELEIYVPENARLVNELEQLIAATKIMINSTARHPDAGRVWLSDGRKPSGQWKLWERLNGIENHPLCSAGYRLLKEDWSVDMTEHSHPGSCICSPREQALKMALKSAAPRDKFDLAIGRLWLFGPILRKEFRCLKTTLEIKLTPDEIETACNERYATWPSEHLKTPDKLAKGKEELFKILGLLQDAIETFVGPENVVIKRETERLTWIVRAAICAIVKHPEYQFQPDGPVTIRKK